MITANKQLVQATLTQGVLTIQTDLITLYQSNLTTLATQTAVLAGFSFTALSQTNTSSDSSILGTSGIGFDVLEYSYYILFTICFVSSIVVLIHATLVSTLGPSSALKGTSNDSVKVITSHMLSHMIAIYKVACLSIISLFIGTCIRTWSLYQFELAAGASFCYIIAFMFISIQFTKSITIFENAFIDTFTTDTQNNTDSQSTVINPIRKQLSSDEIETINEAIEATKLKARGILWKRDLPENGGLFSRKYAVLERGTIDFYNSPQEFQQGHNPINPLPYRLWEYSIELDTTKYSSRLISTSLTNALKGTDEFKLTDLLSSEYDLRYAANHYQFGLIPKIQSELIVMHTEELLAHDQKSYEQWTEVLQTVSRAYDFLADNPSVEQVMRTGNVDVESAILAANSPRKA